MSMEVRLTALENRLRQTERALIVERFARQTAEVAQQTEETWPAGVDAEEIGVEDPIIADDTAMTKAERRPSTQKYCVLALTCRGKALQVVRRVSGSRHGGSCAKNSSHISQLDPKECSKPSCRVDGPSAVERVEGLRRTIG